MHNGPRGFRFVLAIALVAAAFTMIVPDAATASPPTILGYASNFDVSDKTDKECHGFEVELEDITDTQVVYTYRNFHYGSPTKTAVAAFPSGHSGVRVRYQASWNGTAWSATTPINGIEHFGVSLNAPAGVQRYTWLCEDSLSPGTLIPYGGSTEGNYYPMPPPVTPRAVVVPTPDGEVVRQEIENAEPPEPGRPRPDAVFVRRYEASSDVDLTLEDLMSGNVNVDEAIANSSLTGELELIDGGDSLSSDDPVSAADDATVMVVDTFAYTGPYDDSHTPACDGQGGANDCVNFVGATRLSRQMFSADLAPATTARSALNVTVMTGPIVSNVGGSVTSGVIPSADPDPGIDCGTSCFTVVDSGTDVTLTASPSAGYHLRGWSGACSGTATSCTVDVNATTGVTATFDPDAPTVFVGPASIVEGKAGTTKALKFTVSLSAVRTTTTKVSYATSDGTATAGVDYTARTGTASILAGKTSATISVTLRGDADVEGDESLSVGVNAVTPVSVLNGTPTATGTIVDDDTTLAPSLTLGDATIYEGNAGTQNAAFTVALSHASATPTPVEYHTADGTATAGSDYTAKSGTMTIAAGATSAKINVVVKGDTVAEGDETFRVIVDGTGASGIATDHDKVVATITDDDTLGFVGVGIGDASAVEGHSGTRTVTLVVTLSAPSLTNTVVQYRTIAGSALAGADYVTKTGSLTILAGKITGVITVSINGDTSLESATERLDVHLDNAGATPIHHGTAKIGLLDDDA